MSLCKGSRGKKRKSQDRIELREVLKFIKFIQLLACSLLLISLIGIFIVRKNEGAVVIYLMVIIVNLAIIFLGRIPVKFIMKKNS